MLNKSFHCNSYLNAVNKLSTESIKLLDSTPSLIKLSQILPTEDSGYYIVIIYYVII